MLQTKLLSVFKTLTVTHRELNVICCQTAYQWETSQDFFHCAISTVHSTHFLFGVLAAKPQCG